MGYQVSRVAGYFNLLSSVSIIGLISLCLAWELWLAPLRPGGSLLVLKAVPLMLALIGIVRGSRYTHQWASLLSLLYVAEGTVRATSDVGPSVPLAWLESFLALAFFTGTVGYARLTRTPRDTGGFIVADSGARSPGTDDSVH